MQWQIKSSYDVWAGEEGDGQVSREGGEVCLRWAEGDAGRGYPSQAHHYRGIHHVDLFQDDGVLETSNLKIK
ncbi:MAG: hypothetical protein MJE68_30550 [Proteobacteria bacterium]|nr:hypothetical protein [Pseudomonadota bacterium]